MKSISERLRRIIAGAVSAVMVLTSLPLTGVAVYAAPSGNVVEDVAVDAAQEAVADDAGETAVADEASEPAAAEETASGDVILIFDRGEERGITAVTVNGEDKTFVGDAATVSANVSRNSTCTFRVTKDSDSDFVIAEHGTRDEEDSCLFTLEATDDLTIELSLDAFQIGLADDTVTAEFTGTIGSDNYVKDPIEDITFTLGNVSENYVSCTVTAEAGDLELPVSEDEGIYRISANEIKKAVFEQQEDIEINVTGIKYKASKIIAPVNTAEVKYQVIESSLVNFGGDSYAKRGTDYKFKVEPTPASVSAGKAIGKVTYTVGAGEAKTVTADGEGFYSIPAADIVSAAKADENIKIAATMIQEKQDVTFRVTGPVSINRITYGPIQGTEYTVSMADATKESGAVAKVDTASEQVMMVHVPLLDTILLSDSVKVDGKTVDPYNMGQSDRDVRTFCYRISVNEAPVTVDVTAYKRKPVSFNDVRDASGKTLVKVVGSYGLENISISGVSENNLPRGEEITFSCTLPRPLTDYDVILKDPTVYYEKSDGTKVDITPEFRDGNPSLYYTYAIKKADVEAAIKAGAAIHVEANAVPIEKVKATIEIPAKAKNELGDITGITCLEQASKGIKETNISGGEWEIVSRNGAWYAKADIELQKGNSLVIKNIDFKDDDVKAVDFVRVFKGDTEIEGDGYGYDLGSFRENGTANLETARLSADEVAFNIDGNNETISYNLAVDTGKTKELDDGIEYILSEEEDTVLTLDEVINSDTVNKYKLNDIRYAVNGGTTGKVGEKVGSSATHYLDYKVVKEAAFAAADGKGIKLTVSAKVEKNGYKDQELALVGRDGYDVTVQSKGAYLHGVYDYNHTRYDIKYNESASVTVSPDPGYELDKVYVIKGSDKKTAGLSGNDAFDYDKLLEKINAGNLTATAVDPAGDGTVTSSVKSMDGEYTVLVVTKARLELVVSANVIEWQGSTPVPTNVVVKPDSHGVYNVLWGVDYNLKVVSGNTALPISRNSISANVGDATVTSDVFGSIPAEDPEGLVFKGAADGVNGKTVTVEFISKNPVRDYELTFKVSKKPTADSLKFEAGVVSGDEIKEAQPLGTSRTYRVSFAPEIAGHAGIMSREGQDLPYGVKATWVNVKDKKGKVTGAILTVTSDAKKDLTEAVIRFHDATARGEDAIFKSVKVKFSTDQVVKADLSEVKAKADTDSITLDFSKAKGFDKATKGLYYKVTISTNNSSEVLWDKDDLEKIVMVPVTETSRTISLVKGGVEDVEPNELTYTVKAELVQVEGLGRGGSYNADKVIARTGDRIVGEVKTISDGVFAKRITLSKAKTAPKIIYGDVVKRGVGMDEFLLATVNYPNIKRGVPVTVQRIKKVELIDSTGKEKAGFVREEQNKIYLTTKGLAPGKYTITAYAVEPKGKDVKASIKVTVAQAIYKAEVKAPTVLYKAPGKAAVIKPTVTYNNGDKKTAPRTKKAEWVVKCLIGDEASAFPAGVTFKKGKITIGKNVTIPSGGMKFQIVARPVDYDHHDNCEIVSQTVEISSELQVPARIAVNGKVIEEGDVLYGEDLSGLVTVLDSDNNELEDVTWTASGALKKMSISNRGFVMTVLLPTKPGNGQIKVTTTDGSKISKTFKYTVGNDKGIAGAIYDLSGAVSYYDDLTGTCEVDNRQAAGLPLYLAVRGRENNSIVNHGIQLDGFRKIKNPKDMVATYGFGFLGTSGEYTLVPTKRNASIKIYEGTGRTKTLKVTLNVTNYGIPAAPKFQTKVTASNKIFTAIGKKVSDRKGSIYTGFDFKSKAAYDRVNYNRVTYTVKYGKNPAPEGTTVRVSVIKDSMIYDMTHFLSEKYEHDGWDDGSLSVKKTLDADGKFSIDFADEQGAFAVPAGTYKLQITPVDEDGSATAKAATVTVKVAALPKKSTLTVKPVIFRGSVSADSSAELAFAKLANVTLSGNTVAGSDAVFGADDAQILDVRGVNVSGKINGFAQMFKLQDGKLVYTGTKSDYYSAKKGIYGEVAVRYTAMDGSKKVVYVPINVKGDF